ncbi:08098de6-c36e-4e40-89e3-1dd66b3bb765 [Thermothielavioides terrestris]|uniref:08098de6-c36e-4e40-89e3-1dd66b3bb765 n=1 Tax=Thermothielavioides terrestris TaxID=2587410 RepID=A0A446BES3_9PEZI|nr:08098de6-c36e-4e40-89e3-1dd66b3bb765 [Thermothielavioides terrestris]
MATPAPASGVSTPLELNPEETDKSLRVSLADLCAKAAAHYAHKQYDEAAEVYAQAAEMQAEMNGEMNPENAEILFLYGRALFKVGQSKSDVLGGKAPEAKKQAKPKPAKVAKPTNGSAPATAEKKDDAVAVTGSSAPASAEAEHKLDEVVAENVAQEAAKKQETRGASIAEQKRPLFHFEGDENLVDSEEDEETEEGEGEEEEEEEEDDLAVAFEVLDLARVLLNKRLESAQADDEAQQGKGKGKESAEVGESATVRHIKERLADTHDLLAEISLENERYASAITDSRASLKYKEELYPFESEIIAEAHYKLSLALEFASVTKSPEDDDDDADTTTTNNNNNTVDQALRDEAAAELEAAINSTKAKLQAKEVELATLHSPEDNEAARRQIADGKEAALGIPSAAGGLSSAASAAAAAAAPEGGNRSQLLQAGEVVSASVSEELRQKATDLTGLVRRKRKAEDDVEARAGNGSGGGGGGLEVKKKPREADVQTAA